MAIQTKLNSKYTQTGFTLVEVVIGIGVFVILLTGLMSSFSILSKSVKTARERTVLASLAASQLENVRNMPYNTIGTVNGNPSGTLADESNPFVTTVETMSYNVFYEVTYIDDGADGTILAGTDNAPNDYKQIKLSVRNNTSLVTTDFVTNVSPQGLEGLNNAGALLIEVFDADGQAVPSANVNITNTDLNPDIILDRTTDASGNLVEVGLPASVNGYTITVTKDGYSSDATAPISVGNPNPTKPHATVVIGQVTQVSFAIDLLADLEIRTVNTVCQGINGVDVNVRGSKLIGTNPDVLKFDQDYTSSGGRVNMTDIEWDTYVPTLLSGQPYTLYGTSPVQQITVLPGSNQTFAFVLGPQSDRSLRVLVKDSATGAPLEGALVHLYDDNSNTDYNGTTGGSVWQQSDWSAGMGQVDWADVAQYFWQDNNIDTTSIPPSLKLITLGSDYVSNGELESSTYDVGEDADFTTLSWLPTSQHPSTSVQIQIASNSDNATWNYIGPDGTTSSFYTVPGTTMHSSHDGDQYIRYKVFMQTSDDQQTPVLTSINLNYVSSCATPGQFMFSDLDGGNNYDIDVTLTGYQSYSEVDFSVNGNQALEILLSP